MSAGATVPLPAGTWAVLRPLYVPELWGARGDLSADDTAAVQSAINASVSGTASGVKGPVLLSKQYRCDSQLLIPAGADIRFVSPAAKLVKNFSTGGGATSAFLVSGDGTLSAKANGIRITGPGTIGASSLAMKGGILSIYGDDFVAEDFVVDTYTGGRALPWRRRSSPRAQRQGAKQRRRGR